jgi:hypothetical protein
VRLVSTQVLTLSKQGRGPSFFIISMKCSKFDPLWALSASDHSIGEERMRLLIEGRSRRFPVDISLNAAFTWLHCSSGKGNDPLLTVRMLRQQMRQCL